MSVNVEPVPGYIEALCEVFKIAGDSSLYLFFFFVPVYKIIKGHWQQLFLICHLFIFKTGFEVLNIANNTLCYLFIYLVL